jgi:predicted Zn finger-like uncharacterized protein
MKTCCPDCQTIFRVTSEQLKARAGKVRCGQCRRVFNALDSLLDDAEAIIVAPVPTPADTPFASETLLHRETPPRTQALLSTQTPRPPNSEEETPPAPTVAMLLREETDADESEKGAETDAGDEHVPTSYEPLGPHRAFLRCARPRAHRRANSPGGAQHFRPCCSERTQPSSRCASDHRRPGGDRRGSHRSLGNRRRRARPPRESEQGSAGVRSLAGRDDKPARPPRSPARRWPRLL